MNSETTFLAPTAAESCDPQPLEVLAVCHRGQTLQDVRRLVAQWPVPARVSWTCDPVDALRIALSQRPVLVLVDARLDRAGGRALIAQLARWRVDLDVLAFDESLGECLGSQPSLWRWSELPRVLRWWVRRHLGQLALPASDSAAAPLPGGA